MQRWNPALQRRTSADRSSGCCAASVASIRRASTIIARTAAMRRWRERFELGPDKTIAEIAAAKLLGRGGAAFPAAQKMQAVAAAPARPHYLVCNADESEPGTFKDRVLMEGDPFAIVEAMTIAAYAAGCEHAYIYMRGEYPLAARRLEGAIAQARAGRACSANLEIELRRGAGAYICGEETALFNSIEGKRGEPRNKPPFPAQAGLFGKPTLINNVETLVNLAADSDRRRRKPTRASERHSRPARGSSRSPARSLHRASTKSRTERRCAR